MPHNNAKLKKTGIIIVFLILLTIFCFLIFKFILSVQDTIDKNDSYASVIEDYSFMIGCENLIHCETEKNGIFERTYLFSDYRNNDEQIKYNTGLFGSSFSYVKKGILKNVSQFRPFPNGLFPSFASQGVFFVHYSNVNCEQINFNSDFSHNYLAVSFDRDMHYEDAIKFFSETDYSVKYCWVNTFANEDNLDSYFFGIGLPPKAEYDQTITYKHFKQAFGFMVYNHKYFAKEDIVAPSQKFIDIISQNYSDTETNFMMNDFTQIKRNLSAKNENSSDNLKIIGVLIEKKNGQQFIKEDADILLKQFDCIHTISS